MRLTLAMLSGGASSSKPPPDAHQGVVIVPKERDLLSVLQARNKGIIIPRPMRPLHTTVYINSSNNAGPRSTVVMVAVSKKMVREVEPRSSTMRACHRVGPRDHVLLVNERRVQGHGGAAVVHVS
jgi:hypothetical protein